MSKLRPKPIYEGGTAYDANPDVIRIVAVCKAAGHDVTPADAVHIWQDYSESMRAGWIALPGDDDSLLWQVLASSDAAPSKTN